MGWVKRLNAYFKEQLSLRNLLKVLLLLLILYFLSRTATVWMAWFTMLKAILTPFLIGFLIAYILHPAIAVLQRWGFSRRIAIPLMGLLILIFLLAVVMMIVPLVYEKTMELINAMILGINRLYDHYTQMNEDVPNFLITGAVEQLTQALNDTKSWLPDFYEMLPQLVSRLLSWISSAVFSLIISVYLLFDYERIRDWILALAWRADRELPVLIREVSREVSGYLRSLLILMAIKWVEYSLLYMLIGHPSAMTIGLLTAIGLIIPYFGATLANLIGILTSLTLPLPQVLLLVMGICVLSAVDAYVIAPWVHSRSSQVPPLWTLFSVFAGGMLWGPAGIMIAVPVYMSLRVIVNFVWFRKEPAEQQEEK